jgi:hypothetical protein
MIQLWQGPEHLDASSIWTIVWYSSLLTLLLEGMFTLCTATISRDGSTVMYWPSHLR